ncbi:regulator of chromosome condensation 1/beta-lactamase-inhibitor protein II [Dipodascopsis tothii]|uniref:regulator of chromosome condensation 1/beta-lactamase-inhibitor protein II n=1 Tax=Dipodascopsis tothii TaxID=44089 RepID=UPI0034CFFDE7
MALRDLVLGETVGVAVTARGDVVQWGDGYDAAARQPEVTLAGKNVSRAVISGGCVYALAAKGDRVWVLPAAKADPTPARSFAPALGRRETVTALEAGDAHLVALTSAGRVFTALTGLAPVTSTEGQLGVPVLLDGSSTAEPNEFYLVHSLAAVDAVQVAAGAHHTLVRSADGAVWSFGENSHGQLGFDYTDATAFVPVPTEVPFDLKYRRRVHAAVDYIAAGANQSFFRVARSDVPAKDLWVSGDGLFGQHGTGRFAHVLGRPSVVRAITDLSEYSEADRALVPIPLRYLSIGPTHVAAAFDNAPDPDHTPAGGHSGRIVSVWGGNESYQLGTGKRNNVAVPVAPLDLAADRSANSRLVLPTVRTRAGVLESTVVAGHLATAVYCRPT